MSNFYAYKSVAGSKLGADPGNFKPLYVLFREEDIKRGIVVPSHDPMLQHDPSYQFEARNMADAHRVLAERIARPSF